MVATEDSSLNKFDDDFSRQAKEYTLRKYGNFLQNFAMSMHLVWPEKIACNSVWDITKNPIELEASHEESLELQRLVDTEDANFNRIIITFASLCDEMLFLAREASSNFFTPLLFYGEGAHPSLKEDAYMQLGRFLPLLKEVTEFIFRCKEVIRNCVQQLTLLHDVERRQQKKIDLNGIRMAAVYEYLGVLLRVLATLDHIVDHQNVLKEHWKLYKRMMKGVQLSPESFGSSAEETGHFRILNSEIESCILQSRMLETCVKQQFDDSSADVCVTKNSTLSEEWMMFIKESWMQVDSKLGTGLESLEEDKILEIMCLYVAHFNLFQATEKKLFKSMWDSHKKRPCIVVAGSSVVFPPSFLLEKLPHMKSLINQKAIQLESSNRLLWLQNAVQSLNNFEKSMEASVKIWILRLEVCLLKPSQNFNDDLNEKCKIILQGVEFAKKLRSASSTLFAVHASLKQPMLKSTVLSACHLMESIKILLSSFYKWSMVMSESLMQIAQYVTMLALSVVSSVQKRLKTDKRVSKETLLGLNLISNCLSGPATRERMVLVKLAIGVCQRQKAMKDDEVQVLWQCVSDLDTIGNFKSRLLQSVDCSFIYWHKVTFPIYLNFISENPPECFKLKYFLQALEDCEASIGKVHHLSSPSTLTQDFQQSIATQLQQNFLDVVCREVETDLRLNTHTHLKLDSRNPFKTPPKHLTHFIQMSTLKIFGLRINVKVYIESYLNKTFYNLTTVALHDWKTYSEMKIWAQQKYGLTLLEPHLPSQTLEQGLDILEIMRNIHLFVSKYLYNLNNQIFVEKWSNNKHLNTINIKHLANSIRTHGIGIMNTAVNFTYQFLAKKFFIFSQFLYDEHIKSKLIKDIRYFRENQLKSNQKYSFERAEKFNRGIRKLGLTNDGLSYLDQFRLLISEIGNALGYVRLVRSGGLHCCGNAIRFVPDIDDVVNFEELCKEDSLTEECTKSAKLFDEVIANMSKHFAEGTEYFKMLLDVFAPEFKSPKNIHLKNFFIILPPLTLNFVEHMISSKEKLNKKNKTGAAFTDDGFAMGIAYILKLLDQCNEFDSLHWFQSVKEKYHKEKEDVLKQSIPAKDEKLKQTTNLTLKRIENYEQEFELLYFSLSSARIFFRADYDIEEEKSLSAGSGKDEPINA